jgi:hypothetical protein
MSFGEILGAGAGIVGSIFGADAQGDANEQAAQTQNAATAAQLQLGRESLALNTDIYNSNYGLLSPYVSRGNVAGDALNALLGLPSAPAMTSPLASPTGQPYSQGGGSGLGPASAPYTPQQIALMWNDGIPGNAEAAQRELDAWNASRAAQPAPAAPAPGAPAPAAPTAATATAAGGGVPAAAAAQGDIANSAMARIMANRAARAPATGTPATPGAAPATPGATPATPAANPTAASATSAMQNFANSAGMKFQLEQGTNAINHMYAGRGALQSGSAMKSISDYAQNTALNNYFMPYMGLLSGQQSVGAGAASSVAGVGSNFGNTAANINAGMGNAINSGAQNIGNLQLANGQNQANMWGGIGSAIGGALGGLSGSSFGFQY